MKEEEEEDKKSKGLISKIISWFKYDDKQDKKINYSLLFNAYISILEIIGLFLVVFLFQNLKESMVTTLYIVGAAGQILVNFAPRISIKMLFYEIMIGIQIILIGLLIVVLVFTVTSVYNIIFICTTILNYAEVTPTFDYESGDICSELKLSYILQLSWIGIIILIRIVGIILGARAYKVLLDAHKEKELKKKNEIRYLKLKLLRKDKMDQVIANRKI